MNVSISPDEALILSQSMFYRAMRSIHLVHRPKLATEKDSLPRWLCSAAIRLSESELRSKLR